MAIKDMDQVLKYNIDNKLSAKTYTGQYRGNIKSELVEDNLYMFGIDQLNLKENSMMELNI